MQHLVVLAFRKRLKHRGYSDVSIRKVKGTASYLVSAIEPLAGVLVSREYDLFEMNTSFR